MRCPLHYYFRYIEGLKIPPRAPMTLGSSVHAALEHNFRQKIDSKLDLPTDEVLDAYSDRFDLAKPETEWEKDEDPAEIKDSGINLLCAYHTGKDRNGEPMMARELNSETRKYEKKIIKPLSPQIQPPLVEEPFEVKFENEVGYTFVGRIDVVDDKDMVRETKTSSKSPTQDQVDSDLQISAYSLGFRVKTGREEKGLVLDYLVKNVSPKVVSIETQRTKDDILRFLKILARISDAVGKGVFYCSCNPMFCNPNNCGWWDFGGTKGCKFGVPD
jgi:putative RecB family exonuclease